MSTNCPSVNLPESFMYKKICTYKSGPFALFFLYLHSSLQTYCFTYYIPILILQVFADTNKRFDVLYTCSMPNLQASTGAKYSANFEIVQVHLNISNGNVI